MEGIIIQRTNPLVTPVAIPTAGTDINGDNSYQNSLSASVDQELCNEETGLISGQPKQSSKGKSTGMH